MLLACDKVREDGAAGSAAPPLVFVAGRDGEMGAALRVLIDQLGCHTEVFASSHALLDRLRDTVPAMLVTDMELSDMSGIELMLQAHQIAPGLPVVVIGRQGDVAASVSAMRGGAVDFLEKPFFQVALMRNLERVLAGLPRERSRV
ncbi:MAG: response regulator [Gammaproteobacteria bacterium]